MSAPEGFENYYAILGVTSCVDMVKPWITAAVVYHPDALRDRDNYELLLKRGEERYRLLALSFSILINPTLRAEFDKHYYSQRLSLSAIAAEADTSAMADLAADDRFAPHFPIMWRHFQTVTLNAGQRLAAWFTTALESSGEVRLPLPRREEKWVLERVAAGAQLIGGTARDVLAAIVRLHAVQAERSCDGPVDSPLGIVRAKLRSNGLPRHWDVPVRAGIITPAMRRMDKESRVLALLFPGAHGELIEQTVQPLDLEAVTDVPPGTPAYLLESKTPKWKRFALFRRAEETRLAEKVNKLPAISEAVAANTLDEQEPELPEASGERTGDEDEVPWDDLALKFVPCILVGDKPPKRTSQGRLVVEPATGKRIPGWTTPTTVPVLDDLPAHSALDALAEPSRPASSPLTRCPSPSRTPRPLRSKTTMKSIHTMPETVQSRGSLSAVADRRYQGRVPEVAQVAARPRLRQTMGGIQRTRATTKQLRIGVDKVGLPQPVVPEAGHCDSDESGLHATPHGPLRAVTAAEKMKFAFRAGIKIAVDKSETWKPDTVGEPAPHFINAFTMQWAAATPRAVAPSFRIVTKQQLPRGSYCRGYGVYLNGQVVWEAWNGRDRRNKYLVRRALDPDVEFQLETVLAGEALVPPPAYAAGGWTSQQIGFFSRRSRRIPSYDRMTTEWTRGPWSLRMLAEFLDKDWDESDEESSAESGSDTETAEVCPVYRTQVTPTSARMIDSGGIARAARSRSVHNTGWLSRVIGRRTPGERDPCHECLLRSADAEARPLAQGQTPLRNVFKKGASRGVDGGRSGLEALTTPRGSPRRRSSLPPLTTLSLQALRSVLPGSAAEAEANAVRRPPRQYLPSAQPEPIRGRS